MRVSSEFRKREISSDLSPKHVMFFEEHVMEQNIARTDPGFS